MDDGEGELIAFRKKHPAPVAVASKIQPQEPVQFRTLTGANIKFLMRATWDAKVASLSNNNDNEALIA